MRDNLPFKSATNTFLVFSLGWEADRQAACAETKEAAFMAKNG
jgi:hypothetical protein